MPRTLQALLPALAVSLLVGAMPARAAGRRADRER